MAVGLNPSNIIYNGKQVATGSQSAVIQPIVCDFLHRLTVVSCMYDHVTSMLMDGVGLHRCIKHSHPVSQQQMNPQEKKQRGWNKLIGIVWLRIASLTEETSSRRRSLRWVRATICAQNFSTYLWSVKENSSREKIIVRGVEGDQKVKLESDREWCRK